MYGSFKKENSYEKRRELYNVMHERFPQRIPIIVEVADKSGLKLNKKKFLTPDEISVGSFLYEIRKQTNLTPEQAIFIFCNDSILVPANNTIGQIYEKYKDDDGFLYLTIALENTFGGMYYINMFGNNIFDKILEQSSQTTRNLLAFL